MRVRAKINILHSLWGSARLHATKVMSCSGQLRGSGAYIHLLVGCWPSYWNSQCLCLFPFKVGIMIIPCSLGHCECDIESSLINVSCYHFYRSQPKIQSLCIPAVLITDSLLLSLVHVFLCSRIFKILNKSIHSLLNCMILTPLDRVKLSDFPIKSESGILSLNWKIYFCLLGSLFWEQ